MAYTFQKTASGTIQVYNNGQLISTTTPQQAALAYGYTGSTSSTPTTSTTTTSTAGTPATTSSSSSSTYQAQLPPIPDSVYAQARQYVQSGGMTAAQAEQWIQAQVSGGLYSGTVDTQKLFPAGMSYVNSGGQTFVYDNSGTGSAIPQVGPSAGSLAQAAIAAAITGAQTLAATGTTGITLAQALQAAKTDPNVLAHFTDTFNIDKNDFQQALSSLQTVANTTAQQEQMKMENERRALAAQSEAAGQAYSGYRGLAEKQLGESESAVVQSNLADYQQKLNQLTSAFESKYGTAATPNASLGFVNPFLSADVNISGQDVNSGSQSTSLTGTLAGGVIGSQLPSSQNPYGTGSVQSDILNLASNYMTTGASIPNTPLK